MNTRSARAATNRLRRSASSVVTRFAFSSKGDTTRRRPASTGPRQATGSRIPSMLRAGHTTTGGGPRSRIRRHSCSMGE